MQEVLVQLVQLQKVDSRIKEIEEVITDLPIQAKALQDKLAKAEIGHETITNAINENKKDYLNLEADINQKKELLTSSQKKLTSVQNNKEYESVLKELDTLKKNISDGELQLKEMMNNGFKYESELAEAENLRSNLKDKLEELNNKKNNEDKELHEELEKLTKEREELIKEIKKPALSKYDRIRTHRNNIGITAVKDEVCNGCYMKIPPQLYVDVKKDKAIYSCPHCQRILFYKNEEEKA